MTKESLQKLIRTAAGEVLAELVIKNCQVVDVYGGCIREGDIALCNGIIAGIGAYRGEQEVDAKGAYALPGLIDSHIHIESSYVTPEEFGRMVIPHGTTTVIADPHEIVNVCGGRGLAYMQQAARYTALDIRYMLPSCVPATPFEHAGAVLDAKAMRELLQKEDIQGIGEFMNFPGVIHCEDSDLAKILLAKEMDKLIDGHSPGLHGKALSAYIAAGVCTDHECSTVEEMEERITKGMYVLLRQGSACHDLRKLLKGVNERNSRRCLLCSDDRQPKTILSEGHVDGHLRICVAEGIDALTAIQMATLNAAECYGLSDRGCLAPGKRGDIVLVEDLTEFQVRNVWIQGKLVARDGQYLLEQGKADTSLVRASFHVKDFSPEKLKLHLTSNQVKVMELQPGSVVTEKRIAKVRLSKEGDFLYDNTQDIVKIAVIERHHSTGNVGLGLLGGYGIKAGAVALSVAHDSHNIITVGTNDQDMAYAVETLIAQEGGIVLAKDQKTVAAMPLPLAGLMSEESGQWVADKLEEIHEKARTELGISGDVEPVMTLCFMSLIVIPKLKVTDTGLFDVEQFAFTPVEA